MKACTTCGKYYDTAYFQKCPICLPPDEYVNTTVRGTRYAKSRIMNLFTYTVWKRIGDAVRGIPKEVLLSMMAEEFPFAYSLMVADEKNHIFIMIGDKFDDNKFAVGDMRSTRIGSNKYRVERFVFCARCAEKKIMTGRWFMQNTVLKYFCGFKKRYCIKCGDYHSKGGSSKGNVANLCRTPPDPNSIRSLAKKYNTTKNYIERHGVPATPFPAHPVGFICGGEDNKQYQIQGVWYDMKKYKPLYRIICQKCLTVFVLEQSFFNEGAFCHVCRR